MPAAEEEAMPLRRTCAVDGCGNRLRSHNVSGVCAKCQARGHRPGSAATTSRGARALPASARTVAVQPGSGPQDAPEPVAPRLLKAAPVEGFTDLAALSVERLVALRREVDGELEERHRKALAEAKAIEEALRGLEREERAAS